MTASGRTALVTGGAGFVGSHLVDRLVRDGWSVRVLDDLSTGREENLAHQRGVVDLRVGDLCDPAQVDEVLDGVEVVFHEGAIPSVPRSIAEPDRTHRVNASGTLNVLERARHADVRRVVLASSSSIYGDTEVLPKEEGMPPNPRSPYALQKHTGEQYARLYAELHGLETVCLRYFNVFGPRQDPSSDYAAVIPRFILAGLLGREITLHGDGEQTRDFTYVADVVAANLLAADARDASGLVLNIGGGRQTSLNELVRTLGELLGTSLRATHGPARAGDVRDSLASVDRAKLVLGYAPRCDLREGLTRTIEHFRDLADSEESK